MDPLLKFFMGSILATFSGIFYWMAINNFSIIKRKFLLTTLLSVIVTPLGAWWVSVSLKATLINDDQG